jgi:anti-anti-sigma factor
MTEPILTVAQRSGPYEVPVLAVDGEIDHDSRRVLQDAATPHVERRGGRLIIDLGNVTFCDSGGLSLFVDLHRRAEAGDGWLRLAGPQGMVLGVLKATNLDRMFTLYDSVDTAAADQAPEDQAPIY